MRPGLDGKLQDELIAVRVHGDRPFYTSREVNRPSRLEPFQNMASLVTGPGSGSPGKAAAQLRLPKMTI